MSIRESIRQRLLVEMEDPDVRQEPIGLYVHFEDIQSVIRKLGFRRYGSVSTTKEMKQANYIGRAPTLSHVKLVQMIRRELAKKNITTTLSDLVDSTYDIKGDLFTIGVLSMMPITENKRDAGKYEIVVEYNAAD